MIKNFVRNLSDSTIRILLNGKDITINNKDDFLNNFSIKKIIRINQKEYKYIPQKIGEIFTHFNIQCSNHKIGENYLLPRIIKHGYFDGKNEELPLLSFDDIYYVKCIDVGDNLSYKDIADSDFEFSLANIKNIDQLKKTILNRYSQSLPHLTEAEILNLGIGITKLKILGKIN